MEGCPIVIMKKGSLKIGVDARPLSHPTTGIGRYTERILSHLVAMGHQWFLYSDREIFPGAYIQSNVSLRTGTIRCNNLSSLYSQYQFPLWARQDQIDIFWSPRHHLPLLLPRHIGKVVSIYDLVWDRYPETMTWQGRLLEALLMPRSVAIADRIVSCSQATAADIQQRFAVDDNRIAVVLGAGLLHGSEKLVADKSVQETPYFLFVGTFEPRKNLPRLLQAYARYVSLSDRPIALKLVGAAGWEKVDLNALIDELKLSSQVEILGRVSDGALAGLYQQAYALLMPSLYEGFGLPLVEAMHYGVPVLTSNTSSMPEVAGAAGIFVDPNSEHSIYQGLCQIADGQCRDRLGAIAKQRAGHYDWSVSADSMLKVLLSVVN